MILVSAPSPIKNPIDKSNLHGFLKTTGDFKLISNNKNRINGLDSKPKKKTSK